MYKIVKKEVLNSVVVMMEIEAPYVAARCEAGQFVIVRVDEDGERIPLTIADFDRERNTVEIIFQVVGYSTTLMAKLNEGDYLQDFVGPLGQPAPLNKEWKRVIGVAGGVGAAPLYPQAKKLAEQGTKVDVIIGGRTAELVLLKEKFEKFCDNVYIMTDDGSLGEQGVVTKKLQELLDAGVKYDHAIAIGPLIMMKFVVALTKKPEELILAGNEYDEVIAIGPLAMMKFVCLLTKKYGIKTVVSMNPIMIDGTGMCGGCRVTVGGETKFACVDGPDFDGFEVDFDQCMKRQTFFKEEEHECMMKLQADQMQN